MSFVDQDTHQGSGPHANQASPHTHYADLTPDQYLITCDLGTDSLHVYDVSEEGKLTLINQYQTAPGQDLVTWSFILTIRLPISSMN